MRLLASASGVAALAVFVGCGGGGGGGADTLTCAWLAGPDNCWNATALSATSCLPPSAASGAFNADNSACTYDDGSVVAFTPPLTLPPDEDTQWDFTIKNASGQTCLRYQDVNGGLTLTVGSQVVRETPTGGLGIAISCPDGTSVRASNAFALFDCPDGGLNSFPGLAWASSANSLSALLFGGDQSIDLFSCTKI